MPAEVTRPFSGRLVEPFLGGAAVFLHLQPRAALIGDSNSELVNMYMQVRDHPEELMEALDGLNERMLEAASLGYGLPDENGRLSGESVAAARDFYLSVREVEPTDPIQRAARFIFLNRWGWNGLYRVNKKGRFNVPFGGREGMRFRRLYSRSNLLAVSALLNRRDVELVNACFEDVLERVLPGDLVYLDPPYAPISPSSSFTAYTRDSFTLDDQIRLRDCVLRAYERTAGQARFLLSNSDTSLIRELYGSRPFTIHVVTARRVIAASPSSRGELAEVLVTTYEA